MAVRYTDEQRAAAVATAVEHGVTAAAHAHSIPKGTISKWCKAAGVATVSSERNKAAVEAARLHWEQRRQQLADRMGDVIDKALDRVEHELVDRENGSPSKAQTAAVTLAILADKAQLLTGGATSRSEELTGQREGVLADARRRGLAVAV